MHGLATRRVYWHQVAAFKFGFHQQSAHGFLDLAQAALDQGDGFHRLRVHLAMAFQGVDGGEHAAQRVVDFVGDPRRELPYRRQTFRLDDLNFERLLGLALLQHLVVRLEKTAKFVVVAISLVVQALGPFLAHFSHAGGELHQRYRHAPPPVPIEREQDGENQCARQQATP